MDASQAALLLTKASAYDNRTVGDVAALAWAEALADVQFDDAKTAVVDHYRESRAWIMPVDVIARVRTIRATRYANTTLRDAPTELDAATASDRYRTWERTYRLAIQDGTPEPEAYRLAALAAGVGTLEAEVRA